MARQLVFRGPTLITERPAVSAENPVMITQKYGKPNYNGRASKTLLFRTAIQYLTQGSGNRFSLGSNIQLE